MNLNGPNRPQLTATPSEGQRSWHPGAIAAAAAAEAARTFRVERKQNYQRGQDSRAEILSHVSGEVRRRSDRISGSYRSGMMLHCMLHEEHRQAVRMHYGQSRTSGRLVVQPKPSEGRQTVHRTAQHETSTRTIPQLIQRAFETCRAPI
jgi:hypothetical protein